MITCRACPRLVSWREQVAREKRRAYRDFDYWGRPVPGFGDHRARLLVIGLAPGAHGANRTGRVFTGDGSGDFLYEALYEAGFASQPTSRHRDDGMVLTDAFITAVGRCAPPANRPTADELNTCRPYLAREFQLMPQIEVIVTLGQLAFDGCRRMLGELGYKFPRLKFGHALHYPPTMTHPALPHLLTCYHPSRQNTNTGRLTQAMLNDVFKQARALLS
ncbi:MAG: uracil-DNA glycosylase [Anaerolineae bacterium]|nr:uracil-DNA glycosylase [Anaerolineae bacterium]